jgi:hypothetical protein
MDLDRIEAMLGRAASVESEADAEARAVMRRLEVVAGLLRELPASAPPGAKLVWRSGHEIQFIPLDREVGVGRDAANEVVLSAPKVSRRHCAIRGEGDEWVVFDLGSAHGTQVNGDAVEASGRALSDGDLLDVGGEVLVFLR